MQLVSKLLPSRQFLCVLLCFLLNAYAVQRHEPDLPVESTDGPAAARPSRSTTSPSYTTIAEADWKLGWNRTIEAFTVQTSESSRPSLPSLSEIRSCLRTRNILFVGNSHLRLLVVQLLRALDVDTTPLTTKRHSSHAFYIRDSETWIVFLWSTFSLRAPVMEYINDLTDERESHFPEDFDAVVCNRGAWDMLYHDSDPATYYEDLTDDMRSIRTTFPRANLIFMNLNAFHTPNHKTLTDPQKTHRIEQCFNPLRLEAYRSIHKCAIQYLNGWNLRSDQTDKSRLPIWMLDMFPLTRKIHPSWAHSCHKDHRTARPSRTADLVSHDGHHYSDEVNAVFLKVLFSFISEKKTGEERSKWKMLAATHLAERSERSSRAQLHRMVNQTFCETLRDTVAHSHVLDAEARKIRRLCSNSTIYSVDDGIRMERHIC